jgi:small-conductance mechanosensitive channel
LLTLNTFLTMLPRAKKARRRPRRLRDFSNDKGRQLAAPSTVLSVHAALLATLARLLAAALLAALAGLLLLLAWFLTATLLSAAALLTTLLAALLLLTGILVLVRHAFHSSRVCPPQSSQRPAGLKVAMNCAS